MTNVNREYKDRLFRLIFADEANKSNTLALYNALNNSNYTNEEDLEITTLKDVIYIHMKNDLSFIIADSMNLYEQQASHNPNMPLRGLLYFSDLYEKYLSTRGLSLHVNTLVKIPTPNYVVFYNGTKSRPAKEILLLSDSFLNPSKTGNFEWTATVINLNHKDNHTLLENCRPLYEYTYLVSKIQTFQKTMSIGNAVNKAVNECIKENILADFLTAHRSEVLQVYLAEVNEDVLKKNLKAEGELSLLTSLIEKKLKANKSLEQIAAEVEKTVDEIRPLFESISEQLNK